MCEERGILNNKMSMESLLKMIEMLQLKQRRISSQQICKRHADPAILEGGGEGTPIIYK